LEVAGTIFVVVAAAMTSKPEDSIAPASLYHFEPREEVAAAVEEEAVAERHAVSTCCY
jgi:hypothetical protein